MPKHAVYRHAGVVLARASTRPADLELPAEDSPNGEGAAPQSALAWLSRSWRRPEVETAIRFASPALANEIDRVLVTGDGDVRQLHRTIRALASYLLRWNGRATPFGLFAGITWTKIGGHAEAGFGTSHRAMVRADGQWMAAVVDQLERHPLLQPRLKVTVNNAGFTRGDRFVVPAQVAEGTTGVGQLAEVSVRLSGPVRSVLTAAAQPVMVSDVADRLRSRFAGPEQKIVSLVSDLIERGILVTCLRAPATAPDQLLHVLDALRAVDALDTPELAELIAELAQIHQELIRHDSYQDPSEAERLRVCASSRMRTLCPRPEPVLTADLALDADITIPEVVLHEAEAAATVLLRLTAQPFGPTYWKDYQYQFRSRYGPGTLVSVRDLVADSGLGYPASYLGAPRGRPAYAISGRDQAIMTLIQRAAVSGDTEIELTEPLIQALTVGDLAEVVPPSRVEIGFEVQAATADDIRRGRFRLWVTATPRPESSMAGRFAHLLGEHERQLLAATFAATGAEDVPAVQLSFKPRRRDNENLTRTPRLLHQLITISEYPDDSNLISIDDLAVTADASQMYLIQLSTGARIMPRVMNALEATLRTPPLARFLSEVASARHAIYGAFDYGAARELPHLPRLRYGRTVLAPARWLVEAADLTAKSAPMPEWDKALADWRARWRVPSSVLLCQGDQRLPLDLEHAFHRTLLRTRLERAGQLELRESPGDAGRAWPGRPCEFLVPMITDHASRPIRRPPAHLAAPSRLQLPGQAPCLHGQLSGNPGRFGEIMTNHLPNLIKSLGGPLWWYRRDRDTTRPDTDEYLGIYIRLDDGHAYGRAAMHLSRWASSLQDAGLIADLALTSYQFQTGRWGTEAAAGVFAADSVAAIAEIAMTTASGIPTQAIAAASMADLAAHVDVDRDAGFRAVLAQVRQETGKLDRVLRDQTLALADHAIAATDVAAAWRRRRTALGDWRDQLAGQREVASALPSLLHDHHARVVGVDPETERISNRLVRIIALSQLARSRADR